MQATSGFFLKASARAPAIVPNMALRNLPQFSEPQSDFDSLFVNRDNDLRWLDERIFYSRGRQPALFVTGSPGIGKTALLRHFFASRQVPGTPVWLALHSHSDPVVAVTEFIERLYAARSRDELIIIIDDAEVLSDSELQHFISGLLNLKAVRSLLFGSRRTPSIPGID